MRWLLLFVPALTLLGCDRDKDAGSGDDTGGGGSEGPALVLTLDASATSAGEEVGYALAVVEDGAETPVFAESFGSDLESGLVYDDDSLTPTVAGGHTLSASATWEGETLTTSAALEVSAGAATSLDLALSDSSFPAGGSLSYTLTAADAYGNAVDTSAATLTPSSADVTAADGAITGTVAGSYSLEAALDGLSDAEYFQILTGGAASVVLTLTDEDLEVGDSTTAEVYVADAYGNAIDDAYTLTVDGTSEALLDGDTITFPYEGMYTVTATVDGTELYDSVGPLVVDSSGPDLEVWTPERGDWTESATGSVTGLVTDSWSGVVDLTVQGESVAVADDGTFSTDLAWDFGMNVVETVATDGDGNQADDARALLYGQFLTYGSEAPSAMLARMNEGAGGLDELEVLGEGLIAATDLDALIPYPAYSYYEETCIDYWWGEYCWDWYSVNLYITSPRIGSTDLELDPQSTGQLQASFIVTTPSLNWSANGDVVGIGYSGSGTISADSITVTLLLTPSVSDGDIAVSVDSVSVVSSGFDFDFDSWLYDALDYVGVDIDSMIQGYMEDAITDVVYDEVPAVLDAALQDLEIGYSFALGDNDYAFLAVPDAVSVDDTGITLGLGTTFLTESWVIADTGLGSLYYGYSQPDWSGATGTAMSVSADFVSQLFYGLWGGGALEMTLTDEDLGLNPEDLALILPGLTDLTVTTEALLPPVAVPGKGEDLLDLQVGDLLVTLYNGPAEAGYEYMQVYVSAEAGLNLTATSEATLSAELGDTSLTFDVVYPDASSTEAAAAEDLLALLVPLILPELTGALSEIEIPAIEGFTLSGITVTQAGAESGYTVLSGSLSGS